MFSSERHPADFLTKAYAPESDVHEQWNLLALMQDDDQPKPPKDWRRYSGRTARPRVEGIADGGDESDVWRNTQPVSHPEKIGVVLNDSLDRLPTAAELDQVGAQQVRITIRPEYADFLNPDASPEDSARSAQLWNERLQQYKANGIKVIVNAAPELGVGYTLPPRDASPWNVITHDQGDANDPIDYEVVSPPADRSGPAWDAYRQSYLNNLQTLVSNIGDSVDAYEIWNEPDQPRAVYFRDGAVFDPSLSPHDYAALLNDAKSIIGSGEVIVGGLDSGDPQYLNNVAAAGGQFDAVGLHPYGKEEGSALAQIVQDYTSSWAGQGKQIYITEANTNFPSYVRSIGTASDTIDQISGYSFFWRETFDNYSGLLSPDGTPTDQYRTLQALAGRKVN